MFKYIIVILAVIACAAAKPGVLAPLAYSSPLIAAAPGVVTATSSQVIARNYNGIASAPLLAAAPIAAPLTAARYFASPYAAAAPLVASPFAANYLASPYTAPLGYSAPLTASPLGYASAYGYASPLRYAASAPVLF
ncbi:cuticle protein 12.5-like [Eupeodes corollae]|uniref:cuticle protein 12.5-like n=1 Tax=Eupeodes corollae TaxID=290404 RepID=UPI002493ABC2|nr:cuticle protein 12.5-like [Eupeodes corollae]